MNIMGEGTHHDICAKLNDAEVVITSKAVKDGIHSLLKLLKFGTPHGTTCI